MAAATPLVELSRHIIIKILPNHVDGLTKTVHVASIRPLTADEITLLSSNLGAIKTLYGTAQRSWRVTLRNWERGYVYTEELHTLDQIEIEMKAALGDMFYAVEPLVV
jgi:hypothetical protein